MSGRRRGKNLQTAGHTDVNMIVAVALRLDRNSLSFLLVRSSTALRKHHVSNEH